MHTILIVLLVVVSLVVGGFCINFLTAIFTSGNPRIADRLEAADPKPLEVTVTDTDGQWRTFRLGAGDGIGFAGIRVDAIADNQIHLSHYTETE